FRFGPTADIRGNGPAARVTINSRRLSLACSCRHSVAIDDLQHLGHARLLRAFSVEIRLGSAGGGDRIDWPTAAVARCNKRTCVLLQNDSAPGIVTVRAFHPRRRAAGGGSFAI